MQLLKKILNKFNGLHYKQEFLCIGKESFSEVLHIYLVKGNEAIQDLTFSHLFVGYNPLILGFYPSEHVKEFRDKIELALSSALQPEQVLDEKIVLARLTLEKIKIIEEDRNIFIFYECKHGSHRFLSVFHQKILELNNRIHNNNPGNVFLKGNLLKQVQIAYAIPRVISLITVGGNGNYNLFPTDLHGPVGDSFYLISLRQKGKACEQVETCQKILLSEMDCEAYKSVYSLGKNHMQPMKSADHFPFQDKNSKVVGLPIPSHAIRYRELELMNSFDHGIHRIHLFKILFFQKEVKSGTTLAHIHNTYATWRYNRGLPGNYLIR